MRYQEGLVIARGSYDSYESHGFVACVDGDVAAIFRFSHCSCFDTNFALEDCEPDWLGSVETLIEMATRRACLVIEGRSITSEDVDFQYLDEMYSEILQWATNRSPRC